VGVGENKFGARLAHMAAAEKKLDLVGWVLTQHSVLGLCCARSGPPPVVVGACCCVCTDSLPSGRLRGFVFFFVLAATLVMATEMALDKELSGWWQFVMTAFVLLPCTMFVKANIRRFSGWCAGRTPGSLAAKGIRLEELLLLFGLVVYLCSAASRASTEQSNAGLVPRAVALFGRTLMLQWSGEVVALFWCLLFSRIC